MRIGRKERASERANGEVNFFLLPLSLKKIPWYVKKKVKHGTGVKTKASLRKRLKKKKMKKRERKRKRKCKRREKERERKRKRKRKRKKEKLRSRLISGTLLFGRCLTG